jgi:hypothetical protein
MRLESNYILFLFQSKTSSSLLPGVSKVINNSKNEGQTGNREQGREYKNKEEEEKGCPVMLVHVFNTNRKHDKVFAACVLLFFSSSNSYNKTTPPHKK